MSKMTNLYFYFGLIFIFSTVDAHLNLYLNQQEVMRLLGKFILLYLKDLLENIT